MVEFALVAVLAFAVLFVVADLGLVVFGNSIGSNAARDGARVALINYEDADVAGSPNNLAVEAAVRQRLVGLVAFQSATVACRPADDLTATLPCQAGSVDLTRGDLIEVRATWKHRGAAVFGPPTHSATARMVIGGAPDLTTPTTLSSASTTTTTAPTTTTTAPGGDETVVAAQMSDTDHDGRVDRVQVTFSGALEASCAAGWSVTDVPSAGTLSGVSVAGSIATLAITEGPGDPDTAVGAFTVSFAGCPGVAPYSGSPSDGAGPVATSFTDGGGVDGKPEPGDTLDIRFSEPLVPTWGATTSLSVTFERSGNNDAAISIPSLVSGTTFSAGTRDYVARNRSLRFDGSTLAVTGSTLRLTLGSACTGCPDAGVGQGSFSFTPAGSIRDAAGYISIAPITATNIKLF